ncbi:MAG: mechanosensitive ion channel, partial [Nocardioidaceae bacterium]|nr:mechanosensitive ion channel [Nocardioidaceae bacterium]
MDWADIRDFVLGIPLTIIVLILVGLVVRWSLHRVIDRIVHRAEDGVLGDRMSALSTGDPSRRVQRARTMGSLLKSISSGVVIAVVGTMILGEFVDIAPIIASAGILGVAFGFGAQSLVKDFLSGIFMIFEDQYGV